MLQSTIFYIELVCCYNIGSLSFMGSPWAQFGLRTVAWVSTHAADGYAAACPALDYPFLSFLPYLQGYCEKSTRILINRDKRSEECGGNPC